MLASPAAYFPSAQSIWGRLSQPQRVLLVGLAGLAIILIGLFVGFARSPDYGVAFTSLREEDAAAIVAKLKEQKIPYELAERGTIKVPNGQVEEVRLLMAAQGLPQRGSSAGFELFNQPHFGLTEFAEKVNYQRALEGELSRTIARLDAVEAARVHLVMPQQSLFISQQKEPTAAVVLQLKPGRRLDSGQIGGIAQLVAGSVEGLKQQNISIMDGAGVVLGERSSQADPARQTGSRTDVQRTIESRLENDVKGMLTTVLGPDKAIVRVNADLDWDQYEANLETFSPQQKTPQIRARRETSETQVGSAGVAGGVPGSDSNVPTYPGQAQARDQAQPQSERRDVNTTYELSKTVEKITRAPGGIKRLSVAVAVDSEAAGDQAQVQAISRLVATAAGLDENRGDVVTLTSLPFSTSPAAKPSDLAESARQREIILTGARLLGMLLGPLLVGALIWMILPRAKRGQVGRTSIRTTAAGARPGALGGAGDDALQQSGTASLPAPSHAQSARAHQELAGMAERDPAKVAQLIRTWLQEDTRAS